MKRIFLVGLMVMAGLQVSRASAAEEIPLIGVDENGAPVEAFLERGAFKSRFKQAIQLTQEAANEALKTRAQSEPSLGWHLRTIIVGLGVNMEVGIGPILKVGATPRFRLAFSNSADPIVP